MGFDLDQLQGPANGPQKSKRKMRNTEKSDTVKHDDITIEIEEEQKSEESKTENSGCCGGCKRRCFNCWYPCLASHHKPKKKDCTMKKIRYGFMCPPHGPLGTYISLIIVATVVWGAAWSIVEAPILPGSNLFSIYMLFFACSAAGFVFEIIRLPALLGMLLMGAVLRNVPPIDIANNIEEKWSSSLRTIGLVIILVRAGLGLDPGALKKLSLVVVRLAFTPCLVEATTIAVASNLIVGFEWPWAFMQGFVIAAVSPAVVVPEMLKLVAKGYGIQQGVPTLVIAASSIDDVLALTGFSLAMVLAFATGNIADTVTKGPREVISGVFVGILYGLLMWYIPNKRNKHRTFIRFFMLMGGAILFVFGTEDASLQSAGPIGCLTSAFVGAYKWRKQGWKGETNPMNDAMGVAWNIFEPLMFGLIGAVVEVKNLDAKTVGLGCAVIGIGLALRIVTTFCVVSFAGFTFKEKIFIIFSWLPKGTVQAAIGSVAYDTAVRLNRGEEAKSEGLEIITLAVLCILLTAPIGAWLMAVGGPHLLQRADRNPADDVSDEEDSEAGGSEDEEEGTGDNSLPLTEISNRAEINRGFEEDGDIRAHRPNNSVKETNKNNTVNADNEDNVNTTVTNIDNYTRSSSRHSDKVTEL